jgi:hypothetical protein
MGIYQFAACGNFSIVRRTADWLAGRPSKEVVGFVSNLVRRNIYVHAYGDDYFVPETLAYRRQHFRHSSLIIGVDPAAKSFINVCYRSDGRLRSSRISFAEYTESIQLFKYRVAKAGDDALWDEIEHVDRADLEIRFDLVLKQLSDYLEGRRNHTKYLRGGEFALSHAPGLDLDDPSGAYGVSVYEAYRHYLGAVPSLGVDLRATRILLEHKSVVLGCLRAAEDARILQASFSAEYMEHVVQRTQGMHLIVTEAQKRRDQHMLSQVFQILRQIESHERRILGRVLSVLKQG